MVMIDDIQSQIYESRTAAASKSVNELYGRRSTPMSCIKANLIDQVKEKLRQHYGNVLNRPPPPSQINDDDDVITVSPDLDPSKVTGPITTAELRAALSTSKLSSSSGPDGTPVIALRIKEFEDDILNTINQSSKMVDSEYNIPFQWKHLIIVSIPKKGSSLIITHTSLIITHTSLITTHTPLITTHTSLIITHTSLIITHTPLTHHSHITHHHSHITHQH